VATGTVKDVKEATGSLSKHAAGRRSYILNSSASVERADINNMRAMMEADKEYGVYG
jgi:hypothetical protein